MYIYMITKYWEEVYLTVNVKFGRCVFFFFTSFSIFEYVFYFCLAKFFVFVFFFTMNRDCSFKSRQTK